MGCRTNIRLEYGDNKEIFLYSHWDDRESLYKKLHSALSRGIHRWNDPPYLARIIFSEMIKYEVMGETGFGISPYRQDDCDADIVVNLEHQTVDLVPFIEVIKLRKKWFCAIRDENGDCSNKGNTGLCQRFIHGGKHCSEELLD